MKTKRMLCVLLAVLMLLGVTSVAALAADRYGAEYEGYDGGEQQQYMDVSPRHWAFSSINTCSRRSWFNGYPDGSFRPEGLITREEAAKVFAVALGLEIEENPIVTYTDTRDSWARAYIEATKPLFPDATNLQGTASFRPTQTITREETIYALVVAWRYVSKVSNADQSVLNMFSDVRSISAGVKPYVAVAVSEGLVSGMPDGTIAAQRGLSRAEFATLLARALDHGFGPDNTGAPSITVNRYPVETTEEEITLTGSVSSASGGTRLTVDGQTVTLDKNGTFSVSLGLSMGNNSFTFRAENLYGVKSEKTVSVNRGATALEIRILSTIPSETESESVEINGFVKNYAKGCTLFLDDRRVAVDSEGFFELTLALEEGRNTFFLSAEGPNGAYGAESISINRIIPNAQIRVEGSLPDEIGQGSLEIWGYLEPYTTDCMLLLNDNRVSVSDTGRFQATLTLKPGDNEFLLEAVRQNRTVDQLSFTVRRTVVEGGRRVAGGSARRDHR